MNELWTRVPMAPEGDDGEGGGDDPEPQDDKVKGEGGSKGKMVEISQKALDRLIDDRFRDARKKAQDEESAETAKRLKALGVESWDELNERLAGGKGKPDEDATRAAVREATEKLVKEFESKEQRITKELERWKELANTLGVKNAVKAAASQRGAFAADQVVELMKGRFRLNVSDETVEVLTDGGNPAIASNGNPMTVDDAVDEFAGSNPHMFRAPVAGGAGKGSSPASSVKNRYKRSELLDLPKEEKQKVLAGLEAGEISIDETA